MSKTKNKFVYFYWDEAITLDYGNGSGTNLADIACLASASVASHIALAKPD